MHNSNKNVCDAYYNNFYSNDEVIPMDLHTLAMLGNYHLIKEFIKMNPQAINCKNASEWTPLMYAAYNGQEDLCELLIKNGVQVNTQNKRRENSLMIAVKYGGKKIINCLIQAGSDLELVDRRNWTALIYAVKHRNEVALEVLLKAGANSNVREKITLKTPLMFAASAGRTKDVYLLLRAGASTDLLSISRKNAARFALDNGHPQIADIINNWKENVDDRLHLGVILSVPQICSDQQHCLGCHDCTKKDPRLFVFLRNLKLECFFPFFCRMNVNFDGLLTMTEEQLYRCGLTDPLSRRVLIEGLIAWRNRNADPRFLPTPQCQLW